MLNNTESKFGKARPWLLRIAIPSAISLVLAFSVPASMGRTGKIAYVFITYNLLNTVCYTALAIAISALGGYINENQKQRGFFGGGDSFSQKGYLEF